MSKTKIRRPRLKDVLVDPNRAPLYAEGGRRPLTEKKVVPVTVAFDASLFHEIKTLSEKFINPSTLKPYGVSSVARICLEIGIKNLDGATEEDLLYYVPGSKKGTAGRFPIESSTKVTVLVQKEHIESINRYLSTLKMQSKIIGTTTVIRWIIRETIGDVRIKDLYDHIPQSHLDLMQRENLTFRKLLDRYLNSKKT
jgi:hypothetical protein